MAFVVTLHHDPGVPESYLVESATDKWDARAQVLADIGYNPGVPITVGPVPRGGCVTDHTITAGAK